MTLHPSDRLEVAGRRVRAGAVLVVLFVIATAPMLRPAAALAHATLERSVPADHAQLSAAPDHVDLFFAQQLVQNRTGTFAVVLDGSGRRVSSEAQIDPTNGTHMIVPLHGGLDNGVYTVFWKTTSDDDGGVTLGNFAFFLGAVDPQTIAATPAGGQVFVPDSERGRALSAAPPRGSSGFSPLAAGAIGAAAGLIAGGAGVYLARHRRRSGPTPARRAGTGRR